MHSESLLGTFRVFAGRIPSLCWVHSKSLLGTFRVLAGPFRVSAGHIQRESLLGAFSLCWVHSESLLGAFSFCWIVKTRHINRLSLHQG